jgi:hypothetical protein
MGIFRVALFRHGIYLLNGYGFILAPSISGYAVGDGRETLLEPGARNQALSPNQSGRPNGKSVFEWYNPFESLTP